jgi:branched-chain amino acid transport system permease protein
MTVRFARDELTAAGPYLLVPAIALLALPLMRFGTWVELTVAGAAMGMMLFLMAAGLTLIFGLMGVLNFAHGAFITLGAYVAVTVLALLVDWNLATQWPLNLAALAAALLAAAVVAGAVGYAFERVIIMRVYGAHLRQILITVGGLIIAEQLIIAIWGPASIPQIKPATFRGSFELLGGAVEKFRLIAVALGLLVYAGMHLVMNRTRIGLLVRAGVENQEMVEALGYHIRRLFIGVFVAGTALAGVGGVMWGLYNELVSSRIGADMTVLTFIVVIIGGLGSIGGCFLAAVLVALAYNYVGYLAPQLADGTHILLMVLILLWRPRGLFPAAQQ